ncbi:hypothetical protein EVAR_66235_1 [Eumeta japonica]|uniref:Uncharacterized protein n=1 Tax=Eumeta variegata TaxID=151549 RepID=A0A4C1ZZ71_EUMVA|nr:hypothetical protein EVAR_66235_1 [Eumeta japonica]
MKIRSCVAGRGLRSGAPGKPYAAYGIAAGFPLDYPFTTYELALPNLRSRTKAVHDTRTYCISFRSGMRFTSNEATYRHVSPYPSPP